MRSIYYSLFPSTDGGVERQWIQSIRSLRRHNSALPVHVFVYGSVPGLVSDEASRCDVLVHRLPDYVQYLRDRSPRGGALAALPTFHKFLSLSHFDDPRTSQVLCLDCDTFFFADAEALFDGYTSYDWFAREEPTSRLSSWGRDDAHLDEDALDTLFWSHGLRPVAPFNSGVWLLNNGMWREWHGLQTVFLDFAWRLLVGLHLAGVDRATNDWRLYEAVAHTIDAGDSARALPYPSRNPWIVDQVALWLTLGHLPHLSQGLLDPRQVPLNGECWDIPAEGRVVAHYFNACEQSFFETIGALPA